MTSLRPLLTQAFLTHGWDVRDQAELTTAGLTFDVLAENDTAIVFCKVLPADELGTVPELSGQLAAITLRPPAKLKSWEAYLVLVVTDLSELSMEKAQHVQQDLNYCRKVILDGDAILQSDDPLSEAVAKLTFLFPLEAAVPHWLPDVHKLLIDKLVARGIDATLSAALVQGFQEPECRCISVLSSEEGEPE